MNRKEFAQTLAYVETAVKTPLSDKEAEVYWDALRDLPLDVLRIACKRVVLEYEYKSFPSIATLRKAAAETILGQVAAISPDEAWGIAWQAAGRLDLENSHSPYFVNGKEWPSRTAWVMSSVPPLVARAMTNFGLAALAHGKDPVGVMRGQFLKCFEQQIEKRRRLALIPAALQREIEQNSATLPTVAHTALGQIGVEP